MNRLEFMKKLAELLEDIPEQERSEALQFYNGYFYDAGEANEQQVIEELGSPEAVAGIIRREVAADMGSADFSERPGGGFSEDFRNQAGQNAYRAPDYRAYRQKRREERRVYEESYGEDYEGDYKEQGGDEFRKPEWRDGGQSVSNPWKTVVLVGVCILFSPLLIAAAATLFAVVVTIFAMLFVLVVLAAVMTLGFFLAGIIGLIAAVSHIGWSPLWALLEVGISLFAIGFSLVAMWLCWFLVGRAGPAIGRGVKSVWGSLFGRRAKGGYRS